MKIVDLKKFLKSVLIILCMILSISLVISKATFSHGETKYSEIIVGYGDTLWGIAEELQNNNEYYKNKDIRDIIFNLHKINNIENNNLYNGQKLLVIDL